MVNFQLGDRVVAIKVIATGPVSSLHPGDTGTIKHFYDGREYCLRNPEDSAVGVQWDRLINKGGHDLQGNVSEEESGGWYVPWNSLEMGDNTLENE